MEQFNSLMAWRAEVADIYQDVDGLNETLISGITSVADGLGVLRQISSCKKVNRKSWLDKDCRITKQQISIALKHAKADNFSIKSKCNLLSAKSTLRNLLKDKKEQFRKLIIDRIACCKQQSQFWSVRTRTSQQSETDLIT